MHLCVVMPLLCGGRFEHRSICRSRIGVTSASTAFAYDAFRKLGIADRLKLALLLAGNYEASPVSQAGVASDRAAR